MERMSWVESVSVSFSHDAEQVCDVQRASHVRGDTARLVPCLLRATRRAS